MMTDIRIIPLINESTISIIHKAVNPGRAVAGSKPCCAIVINTNAASKIVTENPIRSSDPGGKIKTNIFLNCQQRDR